MELQACYQLAGGARSNPRTQGDIPRRLELGAFGIGIPSGLALLPERHQICRGVWRPLRQPGQWPKDKILQPIIVHRHIDHIMHILTSRGAEQRLTRLPAPNRDSAGHHQSAARRGHPQTRKGWVACPASGQAFSDMGFEPHVHGQQIFGQLHHPEWEQLNRIPSADLEAVASVLDLVVRKVISSSGSLFADEDRALSLKRALGQRPWRPQTENLGPAAGCSAAPEQISRIGGVGQACMCSAAPPLHGH